MHGLRQERLAERHYGRDGLGGAILAVLRDAGKDVEKLTVDDLAPIDQFHPGARSATRGLIQFARLADAGPCEILDIGGGIGGPARMLAADLGASVTVLDVTDEFCQVGEMLTARTGLSQRVRFERGSALALPFADGQFDVVWLQSVAMNIEDKAALFRELRRVLRPGGRLAMQDVAAGPVKPVRYPVPWALGTELSFLVSPDETRDLVEQCGLTVVAGSEALEQLIFGLRPRSRVPRERRPAGQRLPELGEIIWGEELWRPAVSNMLCNLAERRTIHLWLVADRVEAAGEEGKSNAS